jgi:hypothetical protein
MKKAIAALSVALALATVATPALARPHRGAFITYGHVHSGWGPPSNWNDIEISHPEGGG